MTLTEIPAPPFKEERRAAAYLDMMRAHGLEDVKRDGVGNVTGVRRGRGNGSMIAVAAHLDTVFAEGTDVRVRREGTRLYAPGVGDDTRGLAVMLAFMRALDAAGIETEQDLLFVADVGEEGKGDLRGIRHLFGEGEYRERIEGFFTLDSPDMESLVTTAVGSRRYRLVFSGPGGHSLMAFGTVNPAYAMAEVVAGMARFEVPAEPMTSYCASVFSGGTSINAIPEEVWVEVDLRSVSAAELGKLDHALRRLVEAAVDAENARGSTANGRITAELRLIGDRPAGSTPVTSPIVVGVDRRARSIRIQGQAQRVFHRRQHSHEPERTGGADRHRRQRRAGAHPGGMDRRRAGKQPARHVGGAGGNPRHGGLARAAAGG